MDYEANKKFTLAGKPYEPGDVIDETAIDSGKFQQLLRQRYIRPAMTVVGEDSTS